MDNLNETTNRMKQLMGYKYGSMLNEQQVTKISLTEANDKQLDKIIRSLYDGDTEVKRTHDGPGGEYPYTDQTVSQILGKLKEQGHIVGQDVLMVQRLIRATLKDITQGTRRTKLPTLDPFPNDAVQDAFQKAFLGSIGFTDDMTIGDYLKGTIALFHAIGKAADAKADNPKLSHHQSVVDTRTAFPGDKTKPNAAVTTHQQNLTNLTDVEKYKTKSGVKRDFIDGIYGPATARIFLLWKYMNYNKWMEGGSYDKLGGKNATMGAIAGKGKEKATVSGVSTKQHQTTGTDATMATPTT